VCPEGGCSLWKAYAGAEEKCEEEGMAESCIMTFNGKPHSSCTAQDGEEVEELGVKE